MIIALIGSLLFAAPKVAIAGCSEAAEIERIAVIELAGVDRDAAVFCADSRATLSVGDRRRSLDLGGIDPRARARLIAVALGELSVGDIALERPLPEPPPSTKIVTLSVGGLLGFTGGSPPGIGGRAAFGIVGRSRFGARFDLGLTYGFTDVAAGRLSMLLIDAGASVLRRFELDPFRLELRLGARLGAADLHGSAKDQSTTDASSVVGLWGGPFAATALNLPTGPFDLTLDLEVGVVARPVIGLVAANPEIAVKGAWAAIHAGFAFDWM